MNEITVRNNQTPSVFGSISAFEDAQRMAKILVASKLVPKEFQNNLPDCMIALEMSNRMGANPIAVMQNLYIVHGKPSWSAQFIIAAINQSGRFKSTIMYDMSGEGDQKGCIAYAFDFEGNRVNSPRVTIDMAKKEGWYSKNGSKWQTMEDLMLMYRSATFFGRLYTPDLLMGMSTKDEMDDGVIEVVPEEPTVNLDDLLKKGAPQQIAQPEQTPPPPGKFQKLKIALRKKELKPEEAVEFAEFHNLTDEQLNTVMDDVAGFEQLVETYKNEMTKE
jgi:hypothetical protein